MLYVTTRNKYDAYTAYSILCRDLGNDGGLFVPFRFPDTILWNYEEWSQYTFGERVAKILNLFFSCRLNGTDIDFCLGRNPARLVPMFHRIYIGELWHNPKWSLSAAERNLTSLILSNGMIPNHVGSWTKIVIRMALLFGLFGDLTAIGDIDDRKTVDVSIASKDFLSVSAAWYARRLGLPIGNIICACSEDSSVWEFLRHGIYTTRAGEMHDGLERLICSAAGFPEAASFYQACSSDSIYTPNRMAYEKLREGFFAAAISDIRLETTAKKVFHTNGYLMGPDTALAYSGLQDYRSKSFETGTALILCETPPAASADFIAKAFGVSRKSMEDKLCGM